MLDDTIGYTIVSSYCWYLDKDEIAIRPFNIEENVLIQTYPSNYFDGFDGKISKGDLNKIIANSVPPLFSEKVARCFKKMYH